MADSPLGRVILTALLAFVGGGFLWMGLWGLRGRDTHLPATGSWDGHPVYDGDPPLRGRNARWLGFGYLVFGLAATGAAISMWF